MNSKGKVTGIVGLPGTGLSYSKSLNANSKHSVSNIQADSRADINNDSNSYQINDENNNNGFKIRFLSKDNILFYATEKVVEFTVNYGTKKAQFHSWKTEDITRVEIIGNKMVFGTAWANPLPRRGRLPPHRQRQPAAVIVISNRPELA